MMGHNSSGARVLTELEMGIILACEEGKCSRVGVEVATNMLGARAEEG